MTIRTIALIIICILLCNYSFTQEESEANAAADMARKLQDPLANIRAIFSDNDLLFKTGQDDFSFSSSIQPVFAWSFDDAGFNFIARGVFPIVGLAPEAQRPIIGPPLPSGESTTWGLSDIITQFFFSPKTEAAWKWGAGPMISWRTRTDSKLAGAGWGTGPVFVLVGGSGDFGFAFIGGQMWGFDGNFSTAIFQPMIYYNFPNAPGLALSYNNQWAYNWQATSGNEFTLPLGLGISKTFVMAGGNALDLGIGPYFNAVRPEGAASFMLRINVAWVFP